MRDDVKYGFDGSVKRLWFLGWSEFRRWGAALFTLLVWSRQDSLRGNYPGRHG